MVVERPQLCIHLKKFLASVMGRSLDGGLWYLLSIFMAIKVIAATGSEGPD